MGDEAALSEAALSEDDDAASDGASQAPSETPSVRAKKYREFVAQTPEDELLNYVDKPIKPECDPYDPVPLRIRPLDGAPEPAWDFVDGDVAAVCSRPGRWKPLPKRQRPLKDFEAHHHADDLAVLSRVLHLFDAAGYGVQKGLTEAEVRRLEAHYRWQFPPEPRYLLRLGVPTRGGWHDWHRQLARVKGRPPRLAVPEPTAPDDQRAVPGPEGDVVFQLASAGSSARLVWRHSGRFECAAYEAGAGAKARAASTGELFPEDGPVREVHELRWELDAVAGDPGYAPWWLDASLFVGQLVVSDGDSTVYFPLPEAWDGAELPDALRDLRDMARRAGVTCDLPPCERVLLPGPCGDVSFAFDADAGRVFWVHTGDHDCADYAVGLAAAVRAGAWGDDATHVVETLAWVAGPPGNVPYEQWWTDGDAFQGYLSATDALGETRFPLPSAWNPVDLPECLGLLRVLARHAGLKHGIGADVAVARVDDAPRAAVARDATPPGLPHPACAPLVPLFANRMMPGVPHGEGNPVFALHRCEDIAVVGANFWAWLVAEFDDTVDGLEDAVPESWFRTAPRGVPFWPRCGATGRECRGESWGGDDDDTSTDEGDYDDTYDDGDLPAPPPAGAGAAPFPPPPPPG